MFTSRIAASLAAGVLVATGLATGPAHADPTPSVTAIPECGKVTLQFSNPTDFLFVFDYRVDRERPKHGPIAVGAIKEGPLAGQPFGPRWNLVSLDGSAGQHSHSITLPFREDSGLHSVTYRLAEGGEQKMYFDWQAPVQVRTNCQPNRVRADAPTVVQPECGAERGKVIVPADRGVTYKVRSGDRPWRTVRAGEYPARPGVYWVRAEARDGYRLVGQDRWRLTVDEAEACPAPTPAPTDEPTVTPSPTVSPTTEPTEPPKEEPTEEPTPVPTVTETNTRVVVVNNIPVPSRVDTGLGGLAAK